MLTLLNLGSGMLYNFPEGDFLEAAHEARRKLGVPPHGIPPPPHVVKFQIQVGVPCKEKIICFKGGGEFPLIFQWGDVPQSDPITRYQHFIISNIFAF